MYGSGDGPVSGPQPSTVLRHLLPSISQRQPRASLLLSSRPLHCPQRGFFDKFPHRGSAERAASGEDMAGYT
jgi:hypothetical protein